MRYALVDSRNIPALKAFQEVAKVDQTLIENFVHSLGIDYGDNLYESASIGGFDGVSPIELSAAYGAFARGGYYIEPYSVNKIVITEKDEVIENKYTMNKVMSAETAYLITDMLISAGDDNVGGFKINNTELAAKTGTTSIDADSAAALGLPSSAIMDSWMVTYNTDYVTSTWVGYDKLSKEHYMTSSNIYKVRAAISSAVGTRLYQANKKFTVPDGIVSVTIEKDTFPLQLPSANTPSYMRVTELFKEGTEPTDVSVRYKSLSNVSNAKYQVNGDNITFTWDEIATPDAINPSYLTNYFNSGYGKNATKYYEQRLTYNNAYIGSLTYDIYVVKDGITSLLGSSTSGSYTVNLSLLDGYKNIIIKSSYSIFAEADSPGTNLKVEYKVTHPEEDDFVMGNDDKEDKPSTSNPSTSLD